LSHRTYIPERGDLLHFNASPSAGREMAGRHFALCLSPQLYCKRSGLAIVLIATSKLKPEHHPRFGFVLPIPEGLIRTGADNGYLLCDCVHQIDFREREAAFVAATPRDLTEKALDLLLTAVEDPAD
jgi:mRNA interferase MazF